MVEALQAAEDMGFGEIDGDVLICVWPDKSKAEALPMTYVTGLHGGLYKGWHGRHGPRYFRARARGAAAEVEVWDVTEAWARYKLAGFRRALKAGVTKPVKVPVKRARRAARQPENPNPGALTPERRRRKDLMREAVPDPDDQKIDRLVWRASSHLQRMLNKGTIKASEALAGEVFYQDFHRAGWHALRAASMEWSPRGERGDNPGVQAARLELYKAFDVMGGLGAPCSQVLIHVIGMEMSIRAWALREGGGVGGWRLDPQTARGLLIGALSVMVAHYGSRGRLRVPGLREKTR